MKVLAKIVGGQVQELEGMETVKDVRRHFKLDKSYAATVAGEPEDDEFELSDLDYVVFAPAVKGGC